MKKYASMIVSCPDVQGIVKDVTSFLFEHGANVSCLEQHIEEGHFFMRVEWELEKFNLDKESFLEAFGEVREKYQISERVDFGLQKPKVALFCSRELHCLADILARVEIGELKIDIPVVISNFEDGRDLVEKFGIKFVHVSAKKGSFVHEEKMLEVMKGFDVDLIGLARYMKVLSGNFLEQVGTDIINVHHSFLPSFVGAKPYDEAHERGVKLIGATAHYVTPELDQGPIIEQYVQRVTHSYDIDRLKLLGRECEKRVFAYAIEKHVANKLTVFKNRTIVFD